MRYPVILSGSEKEIARKITQAFGQNVLSFVYVSFTLKICGFDLLRNEDTTLVCDVNGWSFVKGSPKYYADCAQVKHCGCQL